MKTLFYPKLAWDGIRKNKRMVFPYILTCISMISMFYILIFLSSPGTVALLPRGGVTAVLIMTLGSYVIAIFSVIFLYYTNSFLIRRRASEFGLYNVLGMGKGNLIKIVTLESLITAAISIVSGLFVGIALSKLAELGLLKIIGGTINYKVRIDAVCVKNTVLFYLVIFVVIWLASVIKVGRSSTVSLLKSDKAGEKAPKANWLLGILGLGILGAAYYIAVSIKNPISAILMFFFAVIMVIIATYILMIAGSVLFCRILQKNKKYYYNPRHFVSVSSMVYRMKRNGAGLASIAIIATMVLVMISSASCLWFGTKDMLSKRYPGDINLTVRFSKSELLDEENLDAFRKIVEDYRVANNSEIEIVMDTPYAEITGIGSKNSVDIGHDYRDTIAVNKLRDICFIPLAVYNRQTGQDITLNAGEALAFATGCSVDYDTYELILGDRTKSYRLLDADGKKFYADNYMKDLIPQVTLVIPDLNATSMVFGEEQPDGRRLMSYTWRYCFNVTETSMDKVDYANGLTNAITGTMKDNPANDGFYTVYTEEREYEGVDFIASNGSLFFIGIVLSAVFILAAVLIIYYKQISEGYEDSKRFEVMRKVGMTKREIKKSINSQLLVVFFIPLIFAGLHLAFAFPMIGKVLALFGLFNTNFFMITTVISYAVFAVFYSFVYKVTSNVYYNIVSEAK